MVMGVGGFEGRKSLMLTMGVPYESSTVKHSPTGAYKYIFIKKNIHAYRAETAHNDAGITALAAGP